MTLPSSGNISLSQVATELNLSMPLSMSHPWVRAICGSINLPASLSGARGKSARYSGNQTFTMGSGTHFGQVGMNPPYFVLFGGYNGYINSSNILGESARLAFDTVMPTYQGNFKFTNVSAGVSGIFTYQSPGNWTGFSWPSNCMPGTTLVSGQRTTVSIILEPN